MTAGYIILGAIGWFVLAAALYVLARWEYWKASDDER